MCMCVLFLFRGDHMLSIVNSIDVMVVRTVGKFMDKY